MILVRLRECFHFHDSGGLCFAKLGPPSPRRGETLVPTRRVEPRHPSNLLHLRLQGSLQISACCFTGCFELSGAFRSCQCRWWRRCCRAGYPQHRLAATACLFACPARARGRGKLGWNSVLLAKLPYLVIDLRDPPFFRFSAVRYPTRCVAHRRAMYVLSRRFRKRRVCGP